MTRTGRRLSHYELPSYLSHPFPADPSRGPVPRLPWHKASLTLHVWTVFSSELLEEQGPLGPPASFVHPPALASCLHIHLS